MTARLGRISDFAPGERLEVPPGTVHGFKNTREEPLIVDVDIVFTPPGPRPGAELMGIGVAVAGLVKDGKSVVGPGTPPPTLRPTSAAIPTSGGSVETSLSSTSMLRR